ncbi:MerR family transcriptional regulator [Gordonia polyisoprenivorans]|uniref:MerR family transcriptional regulator n=1 Tax=Gordonia polyisoprenivorans TaxID=84595 RepID=A0A846WLW3_9ACTN|nr:MerR family transcriptional regulator [Gordonia polyisoprenivorans]NKY02289.1 MerR family transcriptional regulator [Gordonia polyisoprenivorans]WCB40282.1 MerR family transcriptional regulator [Gordonia polyisoprenivorans]
MRIAEAAALVGVEVHVLRHWMTWASSCPTAPWPGIASTAPST